MTEHGGNIYRLAEELKIQERKIIDFSASINPLGISKKVKAEIRKNLKYLNKYPDPESKRLRKYIAQYHGIEPEMILCGNGSTELIYLIIRALKPERVLIPAPTFSEYERAVLIDQGSETLKQGGQIEYLLLKEKDGFEIKPEEFIHAMAGNNSLVTPCDMAFLCNPNNPTGLLLRKDNVIKIAEEAKRQNCYLVVDEAFIDFCPEDSVINLVRDNPYLIVLRSMTKFYALSGLRIGYGVFPSQLIERLKTFKEPWSVNSLAQRAAVVALKDNAYRAETYRLIKEEKRFIENRLKRMGINYFPSRTNFYLLRLDGRDGIYKRLEKKAILVRDCSDFKGLGSSYIRIAVKSRRENNILLKSLAVMLYERG
jgi:threonine-phosphate decarboxylase